MLIIGCSKKEQIESRQDGFFVKFPSIEQKSFLIRNSNMRLEMDKVLTRKTTDYNLGFEGGKLFPLPFNRDVNDFSPILDTQLDSIIHKGSYRICDSCFVLKYGYGTGNIKWNYLFKIKGEKIYLEELFFIEPYSSENDTLAYLAKINLSKSIGALNINAIKDSMTRAETRKLKNYKYILRNKS